MAPCSVHCALRHPCAHVRLRHPCVRVRLRHPCARVRLRHPCVLVRPGLVPGSRIWVGNGRGHVEALDMRQAPAKISMGHALKGVAGSVSGTVRRWSRELRGRGAWREGGHEGRGRREAVLCCCDYPGANNLRLSFSFLPPPPHPTCRCHRHQIRALALHPSEPLIASVSLDRHLRVHHSTKRSSLAKLYLKQVCTCVHVATSVRRRFRGSALKQCSWPARPAFATFRVPTCRHSRALRGFHRCRPRLPKAPRTRQRRRGRQRSRRRTRRRSRTTVSGLAAMHGMLAVRTHVVWALGHK